MEYKFSDNADVLKPSAIREILKLSSAPGIIPFSAGNPAPEAFPTDIISGITESLLKADPIGMLQYSVTEGYMPLRNYVKDYMAKKYQTGSDEDEVLITCGAQQVMSLAALSFCQKGDAIICESPSFVGSINALKLSGAELVGVPMQQDGMDIDVLEKELSTRKNVKLIYIIPNFQNPTGITTSEEKRKQIYDLACKYNVLIIEDNPYGDLYFKNPPPATIKSIDKENRVIYAGSFSKVLSPGLRIGYAIANKKIIAKFTALKQTQDVHSNILAQHICYKFMSEHDFEGHLDNLRDIYTKKAKLTLDLAEEYLSDTVEYTKPDGGLFMWCTLPESIDMTAFVKKALEHMVAVVPGTAFLTDAATPCNSFRINYSTPTDDELRRGFAALKQTLDTFK